MQSAALGGCEVNDEVVFPRHNAASACMIVGSVISLVSCSVIVLAYVLVSSLRRQPNGLVFVKSILDILFVSMSLHSYYYIDNDDDCRGPSFVIAAAWAGSEFCFVAMSIDLYLNLRSPFSEIKMRNVLYGVAICAGSITCGNVLAASDGGGLWITGICLTNYCQNRDVNLNFGFGTLMPIGTGFLLSVGVVIYARSTLTGWSDSRVAIWKPRNRMINLTLQYTLSYGLYWFVTLGCLYLPLWGIIATTDDDKDPRDNKNAKRLNRVFTLVLMAKGFPPMVVWMYEWAKQWVQTVRDSGDLNVASAFRFSDESLAPDLNNALRRELVHYLTCGIDALSKTDGTVVKLRPAKFVRRSNPLQRLWADDAAESDGTASYRRMDDEESARGREPASKKRVPSDASMSSDASTTSSLPPVLNIRTQDSTDFVLTEARPGDPFTATVETLFEPQMRRLRAALFSKREYDRSLQHINPGKETQGRSGAFLFKTRDQRLILKTVTESELEVLRSMLEDPASGEFAESASPTTASDSKLTYVDYLVKHRHDSLIMKIVGCFRLTLHEYGGDSKVFIVCLNVLPNTSSVTIDELYDLKGSIIARSAKPPKEGSEVKCKYCHQMYVVQNAQKINERRTHRRSSRLGSLAEPLDGKRASLVRRHTPGIMCSSASRYHEPVMLFKDNDLKRKIALPAGEVLRLKRMIQRDVSWFQAHGIMDYSLLLGIVWGAYVVRRNNSDDEGTTGASKKTTDVEQDREKLDDDELPSNVSGMITECAPMFNSADLSQLHTSATHELDHLSQHDDDDHRFYVRRPRVVEAPKAYYMGIIDILQRFDLSKKAECFAKTKILQKDPCNISCAPPDFYAERFYCFIDEIIADDVQRTEIHTPSVPASV